MSFLSGLSFQFVYFIILHQVVSSVLVVFMHLPTNKFLYYGETIKITTGGNTFCKSILTYVPTFNSCAFSRDFHKIFTFITILGNRKRKIRENSGVYKKKRMVNNGFAMGYNRV